MKTVACFLFLSYIALTVSAQAITSCQPSFDIFNARFDLRPLALDPASSYHVKDLLDKQNHNYTYVFNVCASSTVPLSTCNTWKNGLGPAFQVFENKECVRLGDDVNDVKYSLIDPADPTKGVSMTYLNGEPSPFCSKDGLTTVARNLTINFRCSSTYTPTMDSRVSEKEKCHYTLDFPTIFGCPLQCPFGNRKLCSGNGFCSVDTDSVTPRCFCNTGFYGDACDTTTAPSGPSNCDSTCTAMIFVSILLLVLLVVGFIIYNRFNQLDKLNMRFGALSDSFSPDVDLPGEGQLN